MRLNDRLTDRRLDDYLLPETETLEEFSIFEDALPYDARSESELTREEWPQVH